MRCETGDRGGVISRHYSAYSSAVIVEWKGSLYGIVSDGTRREGCDLWMNV